ncbi:uncharacterized protein [Littorina saxatilis]|uniref:RING-type domain-containing protein n=1 Tax=Littorina saxatilis TaxID=31220 RepID=A0AAN9B6V5_9CAEN
MDVFSQLRTSFRRHASSSSINSNLSTSTDSTNNSSYSGAGDSKKRSANSCHICGKRLLKLAKWRNYFTLPCKCKHVFCKNCITERLQCRQKVLGSVSFDLMWTFPCPGSAQCGQELTVDWSRGHSYSRNLVAKDMASSDDSWEEEDEEELAGGLNEEELAGGLNEEEGKSVYNSHGKMSVLREIG